MCDVVPSELMTFYNDFSLESVEKKKCFSYGVYTI